MPEFPMPPNWVLQTLRAGVVIPAHPLALTSRRKLDERRQRALTRYYHSAGVGGIAVGVHTTQFEIRRPEIGLFKPVLQLAAQTASDCDREANRNTIRIAGICGPTRQAVAEARLARDIGYHIGLLSLAGLSNLDDRALVEHARRVAVEIPLMGFYLQPAVGGRVLSQAFWRRFAEIPNVVAMKMAPFNRYQTLDVIRAVAESGRAGEIALYTGNDDNIVVDLLTEFALPNAPTTAPAQIAGGLLGHWACWTRKAVALLEQCYRIKRNRKTPASMLTLAAQVTDSNAAFFDAANQFAGCIAGIHEVLRRQGLLGNRLCLDPRQRLSPGQSTEIDRVYRAYPHLNDDEFVKAHLDEWMSG